MKKLLICLVAMVCLLGVVGVTYGASGKAIIPTYSIAYGQATNTTLFRISNITNELIDVKITLYNPDGSLLSGNGYVAETGNLINYNENLTDATMSFSLNPNATGYIVLRKSTSNNIYGYGTIEWVQDSKVVNGLIVYGFNALTGSENQSRSLIPVNNCLPF